MHAFVDSISHIEIEFVHGINGELPGVVLFEAPGFVGVKSDRVVPDFVEKDCSGHWSLGLWRFEEL